MISICQGKTVNNIFHRNGYYQYYEYSFSNAVMAEYNGVFYNKNYYCNTINNSRGVGYEIREIVTKIYELTYAL